MLSRLLLLVFLLALPALANAQYWRAMPPVTPETAQMLSFSNDEKFVYYLSQETGGGNIYRVSVKGGAPQQITKYTDGWVLRPIHAAGKPLVIFMRPMTPGQFDFHLFVVSNDGASAPRDLTPGNGKVEMLGASYNGRYVYYTWNKTSADKFDVYRYDVNQNISELVFTNDKDYKAVTWSKDQTKLVLMDPANSAMTKYDIVTTEIAPAEPLDLNGPEQSINGKFLIERSAGTVKVLEAASKTPLALPADITNLAIAPRENHITYTVKQTDGTAKLFLYDVAKKSTTELATI